MLLLVAVVGEGVGPDDASLGVCLSGVVLALPIYCVRNGSKQGVSPQTILSGRCDVLDPAQ